MTAMRPFLVAATLVISSVAASSQTARIDQLSWMAGCWRMEAGNRIIDEMWMAPAGGVMLGTGRTVANGRSVAHEFMQVREQGPEIVFIARPSGQAEATFTRTKSGTREVVFANPTHDFPQRVIYRMRGDMLVGRVEGTENGEERSAEFPMRRVACP